MEHTGLTKSNSPLMKLRQVTRLLLAYVALLPCLSVAVEIDGGIQVGASRTDNVLLAASPGEIDDIVYQASTGIATRIWRQAPGTTAGS